MVIKLMEEFLKALVEVESNVESIRSKLRACGGIAQPYLDVIDGVDPGATLSAAHSYYQYIKLAKGNLQVNSEYFQYIDLELQDLNSTYLTIVDNMMRALSAEDYVSASFLADLAFIIRSYILCTHGGTSDCDWMRDSFKVRVSILRRFSKSRGV
ncbi:MAG: hypothetical protein TU36_007155 [Vulcanisaeta sp. AZ3]